MPPRSYQDAVSHLNSLQSNAAVLEAVRASGGRLSAFAIPEMVEYLERIGYTTADLNKLNVIHVAGTKGKGSTSAFTNSILCRAVPTWKIGLYTSPHMVAVRERIRINGVPISEDDFAKYFFEVWDRLDQTSPQKYASTPDKPGYFRFITLLAFHTFLTLKVDATILEVGVGGTYDSTNIVPTPIVTGVTALGIDHVMVLGKTLSEIAWHKGGIFKEGVPAYTVDQLSEGLESLRQQAEARKASEFTVVPQTAGLSEIKLGLAGAHQIQNANLAIHLARYFLRSRSAFDDQELLPTTFAEGLVNTQWPGRCQTISDPAESKTTWFLDGAHTTESLECCIKWFASPGVGLRPSDHERVCRVLVFNCTSGRSGPSFLESMQAALSSQLIRYDRQDDPSSFFDHVIFCTNVTYADGHFKDDLNSVVTPTDLKTQRTLASVWAASVPKFPASNIHVLPSIQHVVELTRDLARGEDAPALNILVTGSLHLVGGVIEVAGLTAVAL